MRFYISHKLFICFIMSFYKDLVGSVDSSAKGAHDRSKVSDTSALPTGESLRSFMQRKSKVTDSDIHKEACMLQALPRRERRASITHRDAADRRRMIAETVRIRRKVQDSEVSYSPDVCWAINAIVRSDAQEGYDYLAEHYDSLPDEVKAFYDAFSTDRYSSAAHKAYLRLGNYRLVKDDSEEDGDDARSEGSDDDASRNDTRLNSFMRGAVKQERGIDKVVEGAAETTAALSKGAEEALASAQEEVKAAAEDFTDKVSSAYSNAVSEAISAQVQEEAADKASDVIDEEVETGSDMDADDTNLDDLQGSDTDEGTDASEDERPTDSSQPSTMVKDDACDDMPSTPLVVGSEVQLVLSGNIYTGVLSAIGSGSVMISGLPAGCFGGCSCESQDPVASTEAVVPAEVHGEEAPATVDEVVSAEEAVAVPAEGVAAPEGEDVTLEEDIEEVTDSTIPATVSQALASVAEGEDLVDELGATGIMYDDDGEVFIFMTPSYTEIVTVDEAPAWLAAHMEDFEVLPLAEEVVSVSDDAEAVDVDVDTDAGQTDVTVQAEEQGAGEAEVTEDIVSEQQGGSDVEEVVSAEAEESEDPLKEGVIPDVLTPDTIQWGDVENAAQQWGSEFSVSLATNPVDANLLSAAEALTTALSELLPELRLDPSVTEIYYKDRPFVQLTPTMVNVGSVSFMYQTDASGVASFAQQFSKALVQLAHLLAGESEPKEEVSDSELLSEEAKQEVLETVEAEVKKSLEDAGITVEDSQDIVSVAVDKVQDSAPNTYDIPHTLSTYRQIRNTRKVLDSVLSVASEMSGSRITASRYRSMLKAGGKRNKELLSNVVSAVLMTDNLDLVCDSLYRRKLGDTFWMCDNGEKLVKAFKLQDSIAGPCLVSTTPFDTRVSENREVKSIPVGGHTLYVLSL